MSENKLTEEFLGLTSATNYDRVVDLHVPLPENFLLPPQLNNQPRSDLSYSPSEATQNY